MTTKQYKTNKRYMCPYCDTKFLRTDLIEHVETKHPDMIPEGYTAARVIYEVVNKKNYGTCMICKDKVYDWDEKLSKYKNLCNKPSCREAVRQTSINNMMRVYNKPHLLDEPEQQEKMLARRRISGTYKFSTDGTVVPYTGQYEKKLLEFFDKALNVDGKDIQSPGPVFEYEYGGKKHFWITDIYYIPANLVIEVKDGGDNPNNRPMKSYREKQVAKEEMITDKGTFNYLRLTNNNFLQLFEILADIKYDIVEPDRGVKISINENTPVGAIGGIPPANSNNVYIIPTMMNNAFSGEDDENDENMGIYALFDDVAVLEHCNRLKSANIDDLLLPGQLIYEFSGSDDPVNFKNVILDALKNGKTVDNNFILSTLLNRKVLDPDEIIFSDKFKRIDPIYTDDYVKNTIKLTNDHLSGKPVFNDTEDIDDNYAVSSNPDGYFVHEKIRDNDGNDVTICSSYYEIRPSDETIKNYIIPKIKVVEKQIRFTKKQLGGDQENAE